MFWKIYFLIGAIIGLFFCVFTREIINNPEKYDPDDELLPLIITAIDQMGSEVFYLGVFLLSIVLYPVIIIQSVARVLIGWNGNFIYKTLYMSV